ncbi:hypothetical protein GobsT_13190 [Gemmata obscuriglobus]|nr:hypothetical protein GobsT_13190 [Gemmata obscuriglobus]VTS02020.1 Putative restriction endonuclease OS=Prosthecochloris aestuarii (strain DSM 271 / SK 413) GN=Paes_0062 PE=4 SV=1: HNH_2 [Gemmata obscuriglobus UQM 2246]
MAGRNWSRSETLVAFALYCRLPFGRLHARNPEIAAVAVKLGRTSASVAMKCCNLASLDETHQQRGVKGLSKVATLDRTVWNEFLTDPDTVSFEAAKALAELESRPVLPAIEPELAQLEGKEKERVVRVRVNQHFFRELILTGYGEACAVCGLPVSELLVAAHIVPWATDARLRMNPRNGLCLCGTHDRAYERGLLRVSGDYVIRAVVPERVRSSTAVADWLIRFEGQKLQLPQRWIPSPELLERKLALVSGLIA